MGYTLWGHYCNIEPFRKIQHSIIISIVWESYRLLNEHMSGSAPTPKADILIKFFHIYLVFFMLKMHQISVKYVDKKTDPLPKA